MMDKLTGFADYFRKVPAAFLVAIMCVLALVLFLPEKQAAILSVDEFRNQYRVFLGPALLLTLSFCVARIFMFFMQKHNQRKALEAQEENQRKALKAQQENLRKLTPEEKGYLVQFIHGQQNSIYVGMDDGIMAGLRSKGITYLAASMGDLLKGFAFNLQPWARDYLEQNPHLLEGHTGQPMTPRQKLHSRW